MIVLSLWFGFSLVALIYKRAVLKRYSSSAQLLGILAIGPLNFIGIYLDAVYRELEGDSGISRGSRENAGGPIDYDWTAKEVDTDEFDQR